MNQERRNTSTARTLKTLATTYARTSHAGGCVGSDSISDSTREAARQLQGGDDGAAS